MKHRGKGGTDTQHCTYSCFSAMFEPEVDRLSIRCHCGILLTPKISYLYYATVATLHLQIDNRKQKTVLHILMAVTKNKGYSGIQNVHSPTIPVAFLSYSQEVTQRKSLTFKFTLLQKAANIYKVSSSKNK